MMRLLPLNMRPDLKQVELILSKRVTSPGQTSDRTESSLDEESQSLSLPATSSSSSVSGSPESQKAVLGGGHLLASLNIKPEFLSQTTKLWEDFEKRQEDAGTPVDESTTTIELLARFLQHVVSHISQKSKDYVLGSRYDLLQILRSIYTALEGYCGGSDVHATILGMPTITEPLKCDIISAYFQASNLIQRDYSPVPSSYALYRAAEIGHAKVYAIFGGQGMGNPLDELRQLQILYGPLLGNLVEECSQSLEALATSSPQHAFMYPHGLNFASWINQSLSPAHIKHLAQAQVSLPLIGLLQLASYKCLVRLLGCKPKDMKSFFRGIGGHSQGIVTAVVASLAEDWISFQHHCLTALEVLFHIGCRSQESMGVLPTTLKALKDAEENGEGVPSCMLSVKGLRLPQIEPIVAEVNLYLPLSESCEIACINGPHNIVIAGAPNSLHSFSRHLRSIKATPGVSQARTPFSERKPIVSVSYLPVTSPFHTSHLSEASKMVLQDVEHLGFNASNLMISVYNTSNGIDLKSTETKNLIPDIVRLIMTERLDWLSASEFSKATHLIDLGPGKSSEGIGALTEKNKLGRGIRTAIFGTLQATSPELGSRLELFQQLNVVQGRDWKKEFGPELKPSALRGHTIETKLTKLLGLPPVMVAGMTPTTCSPEFVVATMNAGYHIELATGGFSDAISMERAIKEVGANVPPGRGVTCNVIYANPRALKWQISLICQLQSQNTPIEGLTIGAGIPSLDVAGSYIRDLGLKHISFKPGSVEAIKQVVEIAKVHSDFPIILQWTGGRSGGHHSFEDFHEPILQTYHRIRSCPNLILVGGSGFGDGKDSYPYLSGHWATRFGYSPMPFDGILLGSRVMTAVEAPTSQKVKALISQLSGVPDDQWEGSYRRPTGGILTVISEMGEPIHKVATRAVRFWAELDKTIFNIDDKSERLKMLKKRRNEIISRLNADYSKVWFGCTAPNVVSDLDEMTYSQVLSRLLNLTYLQKSRKWIHLSYRELMEEFLAHVEARFQLCDTNTSNGISEHQWEQPSLILQETYTKYPNMVEQLISYQDQDIFTSMCRRKGRKPVPFITALDEHFEYYFKKDSLWQSENLEAVIDEDVGRVCILHGPVAARYSQGTEQSIKEILDGICQDHQQLLTSTDHSSSASPRLDRIAIQSDCELEGNVEELRDSIIRAEDHCLSGPDHQEEHQQEWYSKLIRASHSRLRAVLNTKTVFRENQTFNNPIRKLFRYRNDIWVVTTNEDTPRQSVMTLYEADTTAGGRKVAAISQGVRGTVETKIFVANSFDDTPVALNFSFQLGSSLCPLVETTVYRNEQIKDFYHKIWFGNEERFPSSTDIHEEFCGETFQVTQDSIRNFLLATVGNVGKGESRTAPLDYAVVVAWKALIKPLFLIDGNLMNLLHLRNEFKRIPGAEDIKVDDKLTTTSRITALLQEEAGVFVEITAQISCSGAAKMVVTSQFLYRRTTLSMDAAFKIIASPEKVVVLESLSDVEILRSKPWFKLPDPETKLIGKELVFKTRSRYDYNSNNQPLLKVEGLVLEKTERPQEPLQIGTVDWTSTAGKDNVSGYLNRHGRTTASRSMFEDPLIVEVAADTFVTPDTNSEYAYASGDLNPIHLSVATASYAELPGTITHGMYTSARVRDILSRQICGTETGLFQTYSTSFTNMVLPKEEMQLTLQHVGMEDGNKIFRFKLHNTSTNVTVLTGEALIQNFQTAMLFTGQGSQSKGMGMELRKTSRVARAIWDRADAYFLDNYGFAISDIVINNPTKLTVTFGGVLGRKIRDNYMALRYRSPGAGGSETTQIFPDINDNTRQYTFRAEAGLLSATQFTQPALTLMEFAICEDMKSKGLVSDTNVFAGHSLGEYTAITTMGNFFPLETLMSTVFYRGLAMQVAVKRDDTGMSPFGMCAVNPSRLSIVLLQKELEIMVKAVAEETGLLLEIVNYNVEGQQYVCAGDTRALQCLGKLLDEIHLSPPSSSFSPQINLTLIRSKILTLLPSLPSTPLGAQTLKRGVATTPLVGIDVPFHSSFMLRSVNAFRQFLYGRINVENIYPDVFVGRYVPNLTARIFELEKSYFEFTSGLTGSLVLEKLLKNWDQYCLTESDVDASLAFLQGIRLQV